jgi:hypothetical protein
MADSPKDVRHRTLAKGRVRPEGENSSERRKSVFQRKSVLWLKSVRQRTLAKGRVRPKGENLPMA